MATINDRLLHLEENLDEAATEITTELKTLREQLANGTVTPEALDTLGRLEVKGQALADIIPNAPVVTTPPTDVPPS